MAHGVFMSIKLHFSAAPKRKTSQGNELFVILSDVPLNAVQAPVKGHASEKKLTRGNDSQTSCNSFPRGLR